MLRLMTALDVTIPVLREWWGAHYQIDWDWQGRVYRAVRRSSGAVLTDPEPEALWCKVREDFARNPEVDD